MPPAATSVAAPRYGFPSAATPTQTPFSKSSFSASARTKCASLAYCRSAASTSAARSLWGNTRRPRSVFSGTPRVSNNSMVAAGGKAYSAEYKNRPLCRTKWRNSRTSQSLVTLQRPLPVMSSFCPGPLGLCSTTVTDKPLAQAAPAAISPAAPPPTMTRSVIAPPFADG